MPLSIDRTASLRYPTRMDLLTNSVPVGDRLTGAEALEALLRHEPIQRMAEGHRSVLWFAPKLQWWHLSMDRNLAWQHNPMLNGKTPEESREFLRHWWVNVTGNDQFEWVLWTGDVPERGLV